MDTILYGFDARTPTHVADSSWSDQRRAQYLLRPEISLPFSVDPRVWRKAFSAPTGSFASDFWTDLEALRHVCRAKGLSEDAITLVALAACGDRDRMSALFMPCTPIALDPAWQPLGWDVADSGLVSGLSNCGYRPEEVDALRRVFSPQLNEHGLFNDLDAAEMFCARSDERVPEHAPFLVHQVFRIPSTK
jgi:hypothetical protein